MGRSVSRCVLRLLVALLGIWSLADSGDPSLAAAQAYVANSKSGTVSVIDTTNNTPSGPITVGGEPYRVAVTPNGRFVYVTNATTNSVSVIDTQMTPPMVVTTVPLNGSGRGVAITADGRFAYVVGGQTLHKIDIVNNHTSIASVFIQGSTPFGPDGVAVTPNGAFAYIADANRNVCSLFVIDAVSMTMVRPSPGASQSGPPCTELTPAVGGSVPRDVVVRPDGAYVYNSAFQDGAIQTTRVSDSEYAGGGCFPTGKGPVGITSWGSAGQGSGQFVASANSNGNSVSICRVSDLAGFGEASPTTVPVGGGLKASPQFLAVTPSGQFLYVTLKLQNSVEVLNLASSPPVRVTTIPVGSAPLGIAVAPTTSGPPPPPPPDSPALAVTPGSLGFTGELGLADPGPQSLQVTNTGDGTLNWSALAGSGGASWLTLNPQAGVAPPAASIMVGVKTCGLPVGTYTGSVVVSAPGAAGSPLTIPVSLAVTPPTAPLSLPTAKVCTDRTTYRTGDILHVSLSLRQGVSSNYGDAYLFAPVPGSSSFVSLVPVGGVISPVIGNEPIPFGTGFQVPDFAGTVFDRPFDGTEPPGVYEVSAVLALPGSVPTVPANQLAIGLGSLTFAP